MESAPSPVGFGEALVRRLPLRVVSSSVGDGFTGVGEGVINGVDGDVQSGVDGGADAIGDGEGLQERSRCSWRLNEG